MKISKFSKPNGRRRTVAQYFSTAFMLIAFALTVALTVFTVSLYQILDEEERGVRASEKHVLRQASNEIFRLQRTIDRYVLKLESLDDIYLNFDIVFARTDILSTRNNFLSFGRYMTDIQAVMVKIRALEPLIDAITGPTSAPVLELRDSLNEIQATWEELSFYIYQQSADEVVLSHEKQFELTKFLGLSLGALILSVLVVLAILGRQMHLRKEALLRERDLSTKLVATSKAVEAASQAKSAFLATMSHELRTPLNAISGFSQLLASSNLDETQKNYISYVNESSVKLNSLIQDILDYVELEADTLEYDVTEVVLNSIVSDFQMYLERHIEEEKKKISIELNRGNNLPRTMMTDPVQLSRVLNHIGMNAVKFSKAEGRIVIELRLDTVDDKEYLCFLITDSGIGISEDFQHVLFEAFSQADDSLARKYEGTGLGLAICKQVVSHLNGIIGVQSTQGVGSTFWVKIPYNP